jgi:hypothetical protein
MPSEHFMEEAQMILSVAAEDFPRAGEVRVILKVYILLLQLFICNVHNQSSL